MATINNNLQAPHPRPSAAGLRTIPVIRAGMSAKHAELGPCTTCHSVLGKADRAIPWIHALSLLPHKYRGGVCINCHRIQASLANSVQPVRGGASAASPQLGAVQPRAAAVPPRSGTVPLAMQRPTGNAARSPAVTRPQSVTGTWLGMSVVPITPPVIKQLKLPADSSGLVVSTVMARAAAAGLMAGDVLVSIDGAPVHDMQSFLAATQNGTRAGGTLKVLRTGKPFLVNLGASSPAPAARQPNARAAPPQQGNPGGANATQGTGSNVSGEAQPPKAL
jgi:hypothetical protein